MSGFILELITVQQSRGLSPAGSTQRSSQHLPSVRLTPLCSVWDIATGQFLSCGQLNLALQLQILHPNRPVSLLVISLQSPSSRVLHFGLPTVMSHELCWSQSRGAQRAPTRSQLKVGLPSRLLTALCARHIHCEKAAPLLTSGGSRLHKKENSSTYARGAPGSVCWSAVRHACRRVWPTRCGMMTPDETRMPVDSNYSSPPPLPAAAPPPAPPPLT